jgi:hypothetical protein
MQKMDDVYRKVGIAKALSNAPKWLQRVGRLPIDFNNWLFSTYIPMIKTVKTMEAAGEFRLKNGREMTDAELMDSIKEIQNLYGTMDERLFGRSGTVTSLMRFMFLAPGYAEGNLRTVMLSAMKWKGNDKATRSRVNILNSFVLTGILATVGTMILKGKAPDPPETKDDVRDLFKIDTGRTDADGKRIMIDLMTFDRDYFDVYGKFLTGKGLEIPADLMKRMSGMKAPYVTLLKDMLAVFSGTAVYDWKDDKVWHLTDPVLVKVMKATVHTLETIEPISVSVFRQAKERKVDVVTAAVESMLGFRPAKSEQDLRDSRTMRKLYDLRDRREELFRVLDDTDNPRGALDKYNRNVQSIATSGIISSDVKQELGKLMVDGDAYIGYLVQNLERPGTTDKTKAHALKVLEQFGVSRSEYERYTRYRSKALKQRRRANQHAARNSYMSQYQM